MLSAECQKIPITLGKQNCSSNKRVANSMNNADIS